MLMETVHCGFIPNNSSLGTIDEVGCGPNYSEDIYAPTAYSQTGYASSPVQDSGYLSANYEDTNNNPFTYPETSSFERDKLENTLISGFSDMKVTDSSTKRSMCNLQSPKSSKTKKNSRSSKTNKNATEPERNRKDSFVYDVRLPDEQFLFFVPDMDLVKSHLMFAVREEVEVLKEKILELMDQINSLERENTILRQFAPPEALQQIEQAQPQCGSTQSIQAPQNSSS